MCGAVAENGRVYDSGKEKLTVFLAAVVFIVYLCEKYRAMKYPIGIQSFEDIRQGGYVYIDKTGLIYKLADEGKYYFLSRPRRFGKSLLISTMEAYFSGRRDLFHGLSIEQLEQEWNTYLVLHLDLNTGQYQTVESLLDKINAFLVPLEEEYGHGPGLREAGQRFEYVIRAAAEKSGKRIVLLVDEYDKPMLSTIGNERLQEEYRIILKSFYGVVKSCDRYFKFAFFTGVTKFGKVSVFSDLNNLIDISMNQYYQTICGITEEELKSCFGESIRRLGEDHDETYEEACAHLKKRYDGYHFRQNGVGIYNPFSVLSTFNAGEYGSYLFETGTPSFLVDLLKRDDFYLPDLTEQQVSADFLNSIDSLSVSPIPIIYQSGYLTVKGYDKRFGLYILGYPNEEVEEGWANYLLPFYTHVEGGGGPMFIGHFVNELEKGSPDAFMRRMSTLFSGVSYEIVGDAEKYFQNAFYLITLLLGFYVEVERTLSDGRVDMIAKTKDYIYIFEFKYDKSADEALRQIEEKGYAQPFAMDRRRLFKVGVNFNRERRCIDGWKVV